MMAQRGRHRGASRSRNNNHTSLYETPNRTRTGATFGLAIASLAVLALGDSFETKFLFPAGEDNGVTFHYLDTLEVSWVSNYTEPVLWLFCRRPNDNTPRSQWTEQVADFNGTQTIKLGFQGMSGCWLNLRSGDKLHGVNGINWRYDNTARDQATLGLSVSSTVPSQTAGSPVSSTTRPATTTADPAATTSNTGTTLALPSQAPSPSTDSTTQGLSTGAKAGIGAGVAVAGLAVIGVLAFILTRRRRRRNRADHNNPAELPAAAAGTHAGEQYQSAAVGDGKSAWSPSHYYQGQQYPATAAASPPPQYHSQAVPQEMYSGPMSGAAHEMYVAPESRPAELPSPDNRR